MKTMIPTSRKSGIAAPTGGMKQRSRLAPVNSNLPFNHGSKTRLASGASIPTTPIRSNVEIFKTQPTMSLLATREVPSELSGKPRVIGNESQLEVLYTHTRSIAQSIFVPHFFQKLFPNALSTNKVLTQAKYAKNQKKNVGRIPTAKRSSLLPDTDIDGKSKALNLSDAFDQLKALVRTNVPVITALTDFCILYSSLVFAVTEYDKNTEYTLFFLKQFLQLSLPKRANEFNILFAVLTMSSDAPPVIVGHSKQVLSLLTRHDADLIPRLQLGANHHKAELAELCRGVLQILGTDDPSPAPSLVNSASKVREVPRGTDAPTAAKALSESKTLIEDGSKVEDIDTIVRNNLATMKDHLDSSEVIINGYQMLSSLGHTHTVELTSELLDFGLSILSGESFLSGESAFQAAEAIESYTYSLFNPENPEATLSSVSLTIAKATEPRLTLLMSMLSEYAASINIQKYSEQLQEISQQIQQFHPTFQALPPFLKQSSTPDEGYESIAASIKRLLDKDTVFEETEAIVKSLPSTMIDQYPTYLRGFLRRAFYLFAGKELSIPSKSERDIFNEMNRSYKEMTEEDITEGDFSPGALETELNELTAKRKQEW